MPNLISRPCYTMAMTNGRNAEITMYGEIVETRPVDWWTGEEVPGEFIVLSDFMADLATLKSAETITIHMNSVGGDGYSAIAIHNRLREMSAKKTCIVDSVAMSGGSLIMCACDEVVVNPSSIIMVHKCWSYVHGQHNATSLRKMADGFDVVDKSQAEIYVRKTGKNMEEVLSIMEDETYMTGREAIDMGFADTLNEDAEEVDVSVSADKKHMYVNGHTMRICAMGKLPEHIKTVETAPSGNDNKPAAAGNEGGNPMPKTLEEFRKENPELANQLMAEAQSSVNAAAVQAERQRLADIDAVACLYDDATVNAAKYGDKACTAQEMVYRAAVESAKQGKQFMANAAADTKDANANKVQAAPADNDETDKPLTKSEMLAAGAAAARRALGKKEEK